MACSCSARVASTTPSGMLAGCGVMASASRTGSVRGSAAAGVFAADTAATEAISLGPAAWGTTEDAAAAGVAVLSRAVALCGTAEVSIASTTPAVAGRAASCAALVAAEAGVAMERSPVVCATGCGIGARAAGGADGSATSTGTSGASGSSPNTRCERFRPASSDVADGPAAGVVERGSASGSCSGAATVVGMARASAPRPRSRVSVVSPGGVTACATRAGASAGSSWQLWQMACSTGGRPSITMAAVSAAWAQ